MGPVIDSGRQGVVDNGNLAGEGKGTGGGAGGLHGSGEGGGGPSARRRVPWSPTSIPA